MARTRALLIATFGCDLGDLIDNYFRNMQPWHTGLAEGAGGQYERCAMFTSNQYAINNVLYGAASRGYDDIVLDMLKRGAGEIDACLRVACQFGHVSCARILLNHGAIDVDAGLAASTWEQHTDIARLMIEHGADTSKLSIGGRTIISNMLRSS